MSCSVGEHYTQQEADRDGIVMGHAYTLLSVAQVLDAHGQAINLVKLRNPWGSGEWNGAWSDKSPLWTDDIRGQVDFFSDKDDGIFWMDYNDFKSIFGFWSVNKYVDGNKFTCIPMRSRIKTSQQFKERYKTHEFYLTQIEVKKAGAYTFGVSQYGQRLLPRRADYKYANCIAYLLKGNSKGLIRGCTYVSHNVTRQDRDTFIECHLQPGTYYLYIDMEWQPSTLKWLKKDLSFSVNCYGVSTVQFSENLTEYYDQCELLDEIVHAYCQHCIQNDPSGIKEGKSDYPAEVQIYEEANYWTTGYHFKMFMNTTKSKLYICSHSNLDFKNGLLI